MTHHHPIAAGFANPRPRDHAAHLAAQMLTGLDADWSVAAVRERCWASATFVGQRLHYTLTAHGVGAGAEASRLARQCRRQEFTLRRAFVADVHVAAIAVSPNDARLEVEALVVDAE